MSMTKLVAVAFVCSFAIAHADRKQDAQVTEATFTVKQYAFEAFPSWAMANPAKACPAKLDELNEYTSRKNIKDPWGHDYKMYCGKDLPPGAKVIGIASAGPDGKLGTADDITSWK